MPEQNGQEKTEQATAKRLEDTRAKGQVAKSMEVNSFLIFTIGFVILYVAQNFLGNNVSAAARFLFSSLDTLTLNNDLLHEYAAQSIFYLIETLAPVLIGLTVIALVGTIGQVGFRITPKALKPKFSKLNPIKGMKSKFFSSSSFVELLKSVVKLLVIGGFAYIVLDDIISDSLKLVDFAVIDIIAFMIDSAFSLIWKLAIVFAVIAISDFAFQKYKHKKDLMMSKQEVKDESKQADGDPQIKGKIKGKQLMMARKRMMQDVPKADVVITNPTHYAVALKYEAGNSDAPVVVAKGVDDVAQKIKKIALEHNIPLHEDRELARSLYKLCNIGEAIPAQLFQAVAQILAYVFKLKNKKVKKSIV